MKGYLPPRVPPSSRQAAAQRARRISTTITTLLWIIAALPLLGMLMIYGYSDQAPTALRSFTIALDGMFGSPIWSLIKPAP